MGGNHTWGENSNSKGINANIEFKISPTFTVQFGPDYSRDRFSAQWIGAFTDIEAKNTYGKRYIFATLNQKTLATEMRADWIISPRLSFQVYMQPYFVSGKYTEFKALQMAKSFEFLNYGENGSILEETSPSPGGQAASYLLDPDGSGPAPARTIANPDFNFISLKGNAVLRWEYKPGSSLYLVWTQNREETEQSGEFNPGYSVRHALDLKPENIFLLKASFWF